MIRPVPVDQRLIVDRPGFSRMGTTLLNFIDQKCDLTAYLNDMYTDLFNGIGATEHINFSNRKALSGGLIG